MRELHVYRAIYKQSMSSGRVKDNRSTHQERPLSKQFYPQYTEYPLVYQPSIQIRVLDKVLDKDVMVAFIYES